MREIRHAIGIDISTQAVSAMLIGVGEEMGAPTEIVISREWIASMPYPSEQARRAPSSWVELARECIHDLSRVVPEIELAEAVGVSTTFPGVIAISRYGSVDPELASLYDNTDDAGLGEGGLEAEVARAEEDTLNRMWPGNMAVGLAHLVSSRGLVLEQTAALVPPNTAFAHALLRSVGTDVPSAELMSDLTETVIGGLYDARTLAPVPDSVAALLQRVLPEISPDHIRSLLPRPAPSWTNVVPKRSLPAVRELLGLPNLVSVSVGAGDSPLGTLALSPDRDTVLVVRGSTDSPMLMIDAPGPRSTPRETVLHYPLPSATCAGDPPWCAVAPTLRSGKVWDWVRRLRYPDPCESADTELERLAAEALKRRLTAPLGSLESRPLTFDTALGGERAPEWDPRATGCLSGLVETHSIGDIALAALEGMSVRLRRCLEAMESRYRVSPRKLLLAGGPAHNTLWNWVTQVFTGKKVFATTFSDASLLGAALLGYGASYGGTESDASIAHRLRTVSGFASFHPQVQPTRIGPPDDELAALEKAYLAQAG